MDENKIIDGAFGGPNHQSEDQHTEGGGEGNQNPIDLRTFIRDVIGFTSFIQDEISSAIDDEEIREEVKRISDLPENESHESMEKEIKRLILLFPVAHELKINLLVTIIGTVCSIIGADSVTSIIDEHNQTQINE
jgi:hypothetical protein